MTFSMKIIGVNEFPDGVPTTATGNLPEPAQSDKVVISAEMYGDLMNGIRQALSMRVEVKG